MARKLRTKTSGTGVSPVTPAKQRTGGTPVPRSELAALAAAINETSRKIAEHEESLRNLDAKLHNQLAEFYRQSTKEN